MSERFEDLGVTVTPLAGWHVRMRQHPRCVALVRDEQREVESDGLVESLSIQLAPSGDLASASTTAMRRYVRQGHSDHAVVVVHGRTAHRHRWTDGVRAIVTWFVEVRDRVLEIHCDVDAFRSDPDAELQLGATLLGCVTFDAERP